MSEVSPSAPVKRRRPSRWFKVTVITVLVLANLAAGVALWGVYTGRDFLARADTDRDVTGVLDGATGDSLTFLIVGSDSRDGLSDLKNFGSFTGARGDVPADLAVGHRKVHPRRDAADRLARSVDRE